MALALLDLTDSDEAGHELQIDTGTNNWFELRVGEAIVRRAGARFVDNIIHRTPLSASEGGGDPLAPPQILRLHLPPGIAPGRRAYVQLFTFKDERRSPAYSDVVELPPLIARATARPSQAFSVGEVSAAPADLAVRRIPHRDLAAATSISLDTILAEVLKIAQPVVANLLKSPGDQAAGASGSSAADIVASLLKAALAAVPGVPGQPAAAPVVSETKSLDRTNRFNGERSEAFIFGIDDALIAAAIGPLVQILPQLANAANQKDKDRRAADQAFTSGILKDINQRLLMDKVIEAQRLAQLNQQWAAEGQTPGINPEDLAALSALLAKAQPAPASAAAAAIPVKPLSLAASREVRATPASRAVLEPLPPPPTDWIGGRDPLFPKDKRVAIRFRFTVAAPAPKTPLGNAMLKVTLVDDSNSALRAEKSIPLTSLSANSEIECVFEPSELGQFATGSRVTATGSLRWQGKARAVEALGSSRLVLVGPLFVRALGAEVGAERELTDMRRWRSFWNKIWESPTLDRTDEGRRRWRLDADVRYTILVGTDARNGIMDVKLRTSEDGDDPDSAQTIGRMKAGIEIGVPALASLRPLWDLADLPADALAAVSDRGFRATCGGELQQRVELKGRAGERGLVWAIPTFRLFDVALARVIETGPGGSVSKTADEKIQLPLPVGVRLLGLKSQ